MGAKNKDNILSKQHYKELTERDFYPPYDDRVLKSYIKDVNGGDSFAGYCKYIFDLYEEEGYWD